MNEPICWPTDVCFRVAGLRKELQDTHIDISKLEKDYVRVSDNLTTAIKHIRLLIYSQAPETRKIKQAALDFLYKSEVGY